MTTNKTYTPRSCFEWYPKSINDMIPERFHERNIGIFIINLIDFDPEIGTFSHTPYKQGEWNSKIFFANHGDRTVFQIKDTTYVLNQSPIGTHINDWRGTISEQQMTRDEFIRSAMCRHHK